MGWWLVTGRKKVNPVFVYLGITTFEDKILQPANKWILQSVFEEDFYNRKYRDNIDRNNLIIEDEKLKVYKDEVSNRIKKYYSEKIILRKTRSCLKTTLFMAK